MKARAGTASCERPRGDGGKPRWFFVLYCTLCGDVIKPFDGFYLKVPLASQSVTNLSFRALGGMFSFECAGLRGRERGCLSKYAYVCVLAHTQLFSNVNWLMRGHGDGK